MAGRQLTRSGGTPQTPSMSDESRRGCFVVWLATAAMATAAPAASTWSLVAAARGRAPCRVARGEDCGWRPGRSARRGSPASPAHSGSVRAIGGKHPRVAAAHGARAGARPAITFDVDTHANVVGDAGYRIVVSTRVSR